MDREVGDALGEARDELRGAPVLVPGLRFRDSEVDVVIDRNAWKLFTAGDNAWAREVEEDKAMVAAMRKGITMVVKGTSARGNKTSDEYSLFGVTKAHQAINKACSVR